MKLNLRIKNALCICFGYVTMVSCNQETNIQGKWIKGSETDKLNIIENQFRGFDNAMVETGYRYQELYWAGVDKNWAYGDYQLNKIEKAIQLGLERRPKRELSAKHMLNYAIPEMRKAIKQQDSVIFQNGFTNLTNSCLGCHASERVSFFKVKPPIHRQSPIRN